MGAVEVRCEQQVAQPALYGLRHVHIAVTEQRGGNREDPVGERRLRADAEQEYEGRAYRQCNQWLQRVVPVAGGNVYLWIRMMQCVDAPHQGKAVKSPV